jgi:protein-tyrosine phosphatase
VSNQNSDERRARILTLEGGCNFRDIGGYSTGDGREVRWGRVYRTGVLSYLTQNDHSPLHALGVRTVCDLRRDEERTREPTLWPQHSTAASPRLLSWDDGERIPTIRSFASRRPSTAAGMFDAMIDLYRALPVWMGGRLRGIFERIASAELALIIHCAAGKDRTGIAIAVLLLALGVPRDTVIKDYLLTNEANFEEFIRPRYQAPPGADYLLLALPDDVRRVLFSAEAEFLIAALDQIDRELGGIDAYVERTVGVPESMRERIRAELLA